MTKLNLMKRFLILTLISVLIFSCQKDGVESLDSIEQSENFVSIEEATGIASIIEYPIADNIDLSGSVLKKSPKSKFKNVESVDAIPDENGVTSYYIINYKDNGFVIISADNRINPILAFSNSAKFPLDKDVYPSGIVDWLVGAKDHIKSIRALNMEQTEYTAQAWDPCAIQGQIQLDEFEDDPCNPDDGGGDIYGNGCQNEYETVGPFLQTTWGQWEGYNNLLDYSGCSNTKNRRPPTGCVATAMCQVMRYHQFPDSYNYSIMPDIIWWYNDMSSDGIYEVAKLMDDVGVAVNMDYGCDGSGADTEGEVASSFINDFGYSNAIYAGFNREIVVSNLRKNRPVILKGGSKSGWWIFSTYTDGHAWVCDGFKTTYYCEIGSLYTFLHMNWGWNSEADGWFAYNNWNPTMSDGSTNTFNYERGMVYNIIP